MAFEKKKIKKRIRKLVDALTDENYHTEATMLHNVEKVIDGFGDDWEENCRILAEHLLDHAWGYD